MSNSFAMWLASTDRGMQSVFSNLNFSVLTKHFHSVVKKLHPKNKKFIILLLKHHQVGYSLYLLKAIYLTQYLNVYADGAFVIRVTAEMGHL